MSTDLNAALVRLVNVLTELAQAALREANNSK